jgi:hypothetical protein
VVGEDGMGLENDGQCVHTVSFDDKKIGQAYMHTTVRECDVRERVHGTLSKQKLF